MRQAAVTRRPCRQAHRIGQLSGWLAGLALALSVAACSDIDVEQLKICERLVPAIEPPGTDVEIARTTDDPAAENAVRVVYRTVGPGAEAERWISCRFGGRGFERDRLRLIGVITDRDGALSDVQVFLLRRYWLDLYEAQGTPAPDPGESARSGSRDLLYLLQLG